MASVILGLLECDRVGLAINFCIAAVFKVRVRTLCVLLPNIRGRGVVDAAFCFRRMWSILLKLNFLDFVQII